MDINNVRLTGQIQGLKVFTTKTNKTIYRFDLVNNYAAGMQYSTKQFIIPCVKWGKLNATEGDRVVLEGTVQTRDIKTKAGNDFRVIEVNTDKVMKDETPAEPETREIEDDLPF